MAEPAEAEPHGDFARKRANGGGGNGVDAALLLQASIVEPVLFLGELLAAAAGADKHADAAQLSAGHGPPVEPCVGNRLSGRSGAHRDGTGNMRAVFRFHPDGFIQSLDFSRHLHQVIRRVEAGNAANPAYTLFRPLPECFPANPIRADGPYSSHYDSALLHLHPSPV
jgi:hypothetical protein